jgi:nitrogen regulatory protein PII
MKMIWAVLRTESIQPVIDALGNAGISGLTRMDATGYERRLPVPDKGQHPDMQTGMIMFVLPDNEVAKAVITIRTAAKAGAKTGAGTVSDGRIGENGRIFVTYVEDFFTVRTALKHTGIQDHENHRCDHQE